jgi:cytochrome c-type protein NapC
MRGTAYQEYRQTIHFTNRTGVRASCSDCHVPRDGLHKIGRKLQAAGEVWGKITGVIDTPAKFEAHRAELAQRVWKRMKRTDSLECRQCHVAQAMRADLQGERAQQRHARGFAAGRTCIDCHFGIAHAEPDGPTPRELFGDAGAP